MSYFAAPAFARAAGTPPPASASMATGDFLSSFGTFLGFAGMVNAAIGAYAEADAAKFQGKMQAKDVEFAASESRLNAHAAEEDAAAILQASRHAAGQVSAEYGQIREQNLAAQAASGVTGEGSNAEVQASIELSRQQDVFQFDRNAVRAAAARRSEATNFGNTALMQDASARNLHASARSISPGMAAATSILGTATLVAPRWIYRGRGRY